MNYKDLIKNFSKLKILVVGDLMLDVHDFCSSQNSRPSPEVPNKLVYKSHTIKKLIGGAGNVANNLANLDIDTYFISIAGNDEYFHVFKDLCKQSNIHENIIKDEDRISTVKSRLYIDDEYILRKDNEVSFEISKKIEKKILHKFEKVFEKMDAVILSDYNKGLFTKSLSKKIISLCNNKNIPIIVDFKPNHIDYFHNADLIAPNDVEASVILEKSFDKKNLRQTIEKLHNLLKSKSTVITLGSKGICGLDSNGYVHVPITKGKVVDPCGCGDTVRVGMAIGVSLGLSLKDSIQIGNDMASIVISKIGVGTVSKNELVKLD